jgi:outer membrane protein TolC
MKIINYALIVLLGLGFEIQNASGQTELSKLVNYTLKHSHDIKKSDLQLQESKYMRKEVIGQGLPQIEGSASYSKMMFDKFDIPASIYSMVPTQYAPLIDQLGNLNKLYMIDAGIQVTQLIYSQSYNVGLKTAMKTQELYAILKRHNDDEVIAEVANNYYQTGSLMLQLQTIEKSLDNLNGLFKIAELNYKNDMLKETELSRLKVTITNLDVTRQSIKNGINIQLNYLKALAGMSADSLLVINTSSFINNYEDNKPGIAFNIENVPAFQALLKQNEVYTQQVNLTKAKNYPTLAAYGKFNYSSYNTSSKIKKLTNMNTIGLNLSVPIFTSGSNYAKLKQSMLKQAQLNEDISKNKDLLTIDYNNALAEYQTARELLNVQKDNRELAQKVYKQTLLQYQEGMASLADLLNVNSDFLQADNSYNQQILKCKTSEVRILKASGNLNQLIEGK